MNLLITGAWQQAKENIGLLEKMGHEVRFMQYEKDNIPCSYEWVEGIVCNGLFLSHPIEKFANLKYVQLTSVGFDRVPMDYITNHNIHISNARGVYSIPMAEFAICGVLDLYKKMKCFHYRKKAHNWEKNRDLKELYGKKVCIVGCGSVGTECAKRFSAFGCNVIGFDLYQRRDVYFDSILELSKLKEMLSMMDIIILTLPLTDETFHFMDSAKFEMMKQGAVVVNIARGGIIDTQALLNAMDKLGGAVLDVFEEEPLEAESVLWDMEKVTITPHNSFVGEKNGERLTEMILNNLQDRG